MNEMKVQQQRRQRRRSVVTWSAVVMCAENGIIILMILITNRCDPNSNFFSIRLVQQQRQHQCYFISIHFTAAAAHFLRWDYKV
jgi:hypothetical protein